jgi:hypothetical protein
VAGWVVCDGAVWAKADVVTIAPANAATSMSDFMELSSRERIR